MSRDVALSIGVADAKKLPYVGGALNGARTFHDWATKLGYESKLLTDANGAVTIPVLRQELESLLKPYDVPIHRLVLYFAGHGIIQEAEEALWLLSDWYDDLRAVGVEVLRRRLYRHDIQQIAIFADCCRSLPSDMTTADLTLDGVLGLGPVRRPDTPPIDKFIAAQDGAKTFSVPGPTPEEDRCVFSGVLMEGLWGLKPNAFSRSVQQVTSRSLAEFLKKEVPQRAKIYDRVLHPSLSPTFPEDDDIYFYSGTGKPPTPPVFSDWPPPPALAPPSKGFEKLPIGDTTRLVEEIRNQKRPEAFETGSGFAVGGGRVNALWTMTDVSADRHGHQNWLRLRSLGYPFLKRLAPALIEFEDGTHAAVVAIPEFIATLTRVEKGVAALIYRHVHEPRETAIAAENAIGKMESGALRFETASDLAVDLRRYKHADPVLGVISAYLYDAIGDIDSIRRMAFYYIQHDQPIPYDIALLADLRSERRNGSLWVYVPAVPERKPRTEAEASKKWTYSATPEREGEVAGFWPWMRQGWPFLNDAAAYSPMMVADGLLEIQRHLTPGRFTTLTSEGAERLKWMFDLVPLLSNDGGSIHDT